MSIYIVLILLVIMILSEILRMYFYGKRNVTRWFLVRISTEFIALIIFYLIAYIGAFKSKPYWNPINNAETIRLALYVTLILEILFLIIEGSWQEHIKKLLVAESIKKYIFVFFIIILAVCSFELTIFNFRHFQAIMNHPTVITNYEPNDNLSYADTNAFEVISNEQSPYIEVTDINMPVQNIYMDITFANLGEFAVRETAYHLEFVDEGNANYYPIPGRVYVRQIPQAHFSTLNLYGNCHSFKLYFDNANVGDIIRINDLQINAQYPFIISIKRTIFLTLLIFLFFMFRPKSVLYEIKFCDKFRFRRLVFILLFAAQVLFFWKVVNMNGTFINPQSESERQFALLAEGLAEGKPYLLIEPPETLISMKDPYDYAERMKVVGDANVLWDTVYYQGHYYVYFGIGPIVVFYLPYYLLTGAHIQTYLVVFICALFAVAGVMALLSEIVKRWFKQIPIAFYLMFTLLCTSGCGVLYLMTKADFYAVPLMMGLANVLWGLYFWLNALRTEQKLALKLFAGSFCMAFVAACRPQFLLGSFFAILLFWNMVFKERKLFSKKSVIQTICFVVPYFLVAAGVMYYNAIRFGSPFDFGANYNLTFNNMPYRGIRLDRLLYGTVGFLFFPCNVTNIFPYFGLSNYISRYQGITADERIFGGMIYNHIYLLLTLFVFKFKKYFTDKLAYKMAVLTPIFGLLIMLVDSNMAGTLTRYIVDFTWLFMISSFLILGMVYTKVTDKGYLYAIRMGIFWCFLITVIRLLLSVFGGDGNLEAGNMLLFQRISHLVEFWN